ncbi:MAG: HAMP domain-containing histidine kinase [Bacteroidales bacterium]|nr:HAMP domain-containing histidine kinase [Bacteroidales bacterium]
MSIPVWLYIVSVILGIALASVISVFLVRKHDTKKVSYMMDSLEDGEMNFRFRENSSLNRALNRIRGISKRRSAVDEATSWSKLFRVMTHEIMNTVAPIASLSDALSKDDSLDVKAGLETISASSKDLIKFVESYRSMMKLSSPIRKAVMVDELMERVLNLNQTRLKEQNVTITYNAKTPDLLVYIDESQILQVLNNLIKNAVQAEANSIRISAELNSEDRTIISVTNNGKPVPLRQQDEIFVPFYTTKPNGTGIGLSLSRQIMTKHNGNITLVQSDKNTTTFAMVF